MEFGRAPGGGQRNPPDVTFSVAEPIPSVSRSAGGEEWAGPRRRFRTRTCGCRPGGRNAFGGFIGPSMICFRRSESSSGRRAATTRRCAATRVGGGPDEGGAEPPSGASAAPDSGGVRGRLPKSGLASEGSVRAAGERPGRPASVQRPSSRWAGVAGFRLGVLPLLDSESRSRGPAGARAGTGNDRTLRADPCASPHRIRKTFDRSR